MEMQTRVPSRQSCHPVIRSVHVGRTIDAATIRMELPAASFWPMNSRPANEESRTINNYRRPDAGILQHVEQSTTGDDVDARLLSLYR